MNTDDDEGSLCESKWDDHSLLEPGEELPFNHERLPLPGRESLTSDLQVFLSYLVQMQKVPRTYYECPFNDNFWLFIKSKLEAARPIGYTDMENRYQTLQKGPEDNAALISKFIETSPVNPIYPNVVADMSGIPLNIVLTELLHATAVGMCTMRFTPMCDRCGSPTCATSLHLGKIKFPLTSYCRACRFTSPIDCMEKVKVIFVLNTDVLYTLAENFPCKPSAQSMKLTELYAFVPTTYSGSGFRFSIGCDNGAMLRPALPPGRYRMHCTISLSDCYLLVEKEAMGIDEPYNLKLHVSDLYYKGGDLKVITVPHGKLRFDVFCDTKSFFILWLQQDVNDLEMFYVPVEERLKSCSATVVISQMSYKMLFEGTKYEAEEFSNALAQMTSENELQKSPQNE